MCTAVSVKLKGACCKGHKKAEYCGWRRAIMNEGCVHLQGTRKVPLSTTESVWFWGSSRSFVNVVHWFANERTIRAVIERRARTCQMHPCKGSSVWLRQNKLSWLVCWDVLKQFSLSFCTLLVLPLWQGLFCLLVKEFYGTRYQSGFLFLNQCGEWFLLPA